MGWFFIAAMALILLGALWRFAKLGRGPLQLVASALLLGLAGYAWQGAPGLEGQPLRAAPGTQKLADSPFATLRRDIFGSFDAADWWLNVAESYQRRGDTRSGAVAIHSALKARPGNAILWTGYGNALVLHARGALSPAADLAFRRATQLAPQHPGPRLFYGIALAQNGRFAEGEQVWRQALALAPPNALYRAGLEQQLAAIAAARQTGQLP
jgi:cytochrome c-type biogenesis protein CcmH/NrfG